MEKKTAKVKHYLVLTERVFRGKLLVGEGELKRQFKVLRT